MRLVRLQCGTCYDLYDLLHRQPGGTPHEPPRPCISRAPIGPPPSAPAPPGVKGVSVECWRDQAYRRGISNGETDRAKQRAFSVPGSS